MTFLLFTGDMLRPWTTRMSNKNKQSKCLLSHLTNGKSHSFVGLSGGQIFHEMMLRLGVKHICESEIAKGKVSEKSLVADFLYHRSWIPWWCYLARF